MLALVVLGTGVVGAPLLGDGDEPSGSVIILCGHALGRATRNGVPPATWRHVLRCGGSRSMCERRLVRPLLVCALSILRVVRRAAAQRGYGLM